MRLLGISLASAILAGVAGGCYSTGDGTPPPPKDIYFPVGLAVSRGGNVLYVANSDFDLQWNGGTLQSYDLHLIRKHAVETIADPNNGDIADHLVRAQIQGVDCTADSQTPPVYKTDQSGQRQPLGETCAPPVKSAFYVRDSRTIGAFATDLQLALAQPLCVDDAQHLYTACDTLSCPNGQHCEIAGGLNRLFVPVRGDATLTWSPVTPDDPTPAPDEHLGDVGGGDPLTYPPFRLDCGPRTDSRCDAEHHSGNNGDEAGNTRHITMPGEPFGMAQSQDGTAIAITHQTDTKTSLYDTGLPAGGDPSLQFVLDGVAAGGNGIFAIPHDPEAFEAGQEPRPAFLQTSRASTDLTLLRFYADDGSSLHRPFLVKENVFTLTANAGGTDSRGIVIDPTPRIACKAKVAPVGPGRTQQDVEADRQGCARKPARVFFANRSPASMLVGQIGEPSVTGTYDPDLLTISGNVPLSVGPSKLYLAPIVDVDGTLALRVFIVCFDSATIYVYNPEVGAIENILRVGTGPFAMAFDPFTLEDAALHKKVDPDPREPGLDLKKYRFGYLASFTNSFIQLIDLDNSREKKDTFERVVFTLGLPTLPRGSP
jgi:hypothetical protein